MIAWLAYWLVRWRNRNAWRDVRMARSAAYMDLALHAAVYARQAFRAGCAEDARILLTLSTTLSHVQEAGNGGDAVTVLRAMVQ